MFAKTSATQTFPFAIVFVLLTLFFPPATDTHAQTTHNIDCGDVTGLIDAIADATSGDTVSLAAGCTYTLTTVDNDSGNGPNGLPLIDKTLTIEGNGATITAEGPFRIFEVADTTGDLTLNQVTVANGYLEEDNGGGILNYGTLVVNNSTIINNQGRDGGGIASDSASLTITNSTFSGNSAQITGNAIYSNNGTVDISNSTFTDNAYGGGGVLYTEYDTVTITGSTFAGNTALPEGSVIAGGYSTVTIDASVFYDNIAWFYGVLSNYGGTFTIRNSTFFNNTANIAGGVLIHWSGTSTFINSTLTGNIAGEFGGAIFVTPNHTGSVELQNTIVAGNSAPGAPDIAGTVNSQGYNLIGSTNGTTITGDLTGNITDVDPLLDMLADNGGPTLTVAPLSGSPAIDAGSCPLATDQRGVARPIDFVQLANADAGCDIGALEVQALSFAAHGDTYIVDHGESLDVAAPGVLANDFDPGLNALSATLDTAPAHAQTFNLNADGSFTYTPTAGWYGVDTFSYTASSAGGSGTVTTTIHVGPDFNIACGDVTTLIDAIDHANLNDEADTITLTAGCSYALTTVDNTTLGGSSTGTPIINSVLTIEGNGATIQGTQDAGEPEFAIFRVIAGEVTLNDLTVTKAFHPGRYAMYAGFGSDLTLNNSRVIQNSATGVLSWWAATITLTDSTIADNTGRGGNFSGGTLTVTGSTFTGNTGGGLEFGSSLSTTEATITNSTITGNTADGDGGGIYIHDSTATITNSTIANNTAANTGGGIHLHNGTVTLLGTIVSGNSATVGGNDLYGDFVSNDYNMIQDTNGATITGTTTHNIYGSDPLLGALQDNGGPTHTVALLIGSPAIDAGGACGLATDQRGVFRPQGSACDIGAYEYIPPTCPDGTPDDDVLVCEVSLPHASNPDNNINAGTGHDDITIVAGVSVENVFGDWGNDTVTLYGTVNGTIYAEGGSDTVILQASANGGADHDLPLDGGTGVDVLNFAFSVDAAVRDALATADPAGDSVTIDSETFAWSNFEEIQIQGVNARLIFATISEQELFLVMQAVIADHLAITDIDFALPDCLPGEILLLVRVNDVVGEVHLTITDAGGFAVIEFQNPLVDGVAAPADFVASVNRELPILVIETLDRLVGEHGGLQAITVTETGIDSIWLRYIP